MGNTKKVIKFNTYHNPDIKVGDKVKIFDGSGISSINQPEKDIYIIYDYSELTGSKEKLKDLIGEVIETNVKLKGIEGALSNTVYMQDIVVKFGRGKFRTPSSFVTKVKTPEEILQERIDNFKSTIESLSKFTPSEKYDKDIKVFKGRVELLSGILEEIKNNK